MPDTITEIIASSPVAETPAPATEKKPIRFYQVGGSVRDGIMGIESKDIDFAVEAESYAAMKAAILARGIKIFAEADKYLTIRGNHPELGGVDYVLCRKDGVYSDSRRPDTVQVGSLADDLARRDFTCNAMAIDESGNLIDLYNGKADIDARVLRCVGDTKARLNEDGLRILRAMRFSITRGFVLCPEIRDLLMDFYFIAPLLMKVSPERIREELFKCFSHNTLETLQFLNNFPFLRFQLFKGGDIWLKPTLEQAK